MLREFDEDARRREQKNAKGAGDRLKLRAPAVKVDQVLGGTRGTQIVKRLPRPGTVSKSSRPP